MKLQKLIQSYYIFRIHLLSLISKRKAAQYAFDIFCWPYTRVQYQPANYLSEAEPLELNFEGLKTKGFRWNKGGTKKIYIAHGFRSSATNFTHIAKRLVGKGFEVVAFDAPGHGLSQGNRITSISYKRFIEVVGETYGPFHSYITHSFGGLATCMAVAEMPHNENCKIVLIAPASDTLSLVKMFFMQMKMKDATLQKYFLDEIERLGQKHIDWYTIRRCMKTIKSDLLWVHDNNDRVTPAGDAYAVQALNYNNVKFIFTDGLGHRKIYRDASVINTVIKFL